jgi:cathepsin D
LVNDAVNIGNVHVDSLEFESAVTDSDTESLMGLCFNGDGWSPSFVDAAVRSKQMERKLFTIGISPDALSATINFGSIDRSAHVGNVSYTPVHESSPFWQTSLLSISGAYNWKGKVDAIFDTGTSLLILPPSIVDNVASSLGFRGPDVNGWYSSRACPTDHPETFNMTFPYVSLAVPMEKLFYTYSGYCYLGMMAGDPDKVVVGNIMSRWFFTVYDWEDQRIGFANLNYTDSSVGYGPAEVVVSSGLSWTHIIVILLGIIVVGLIILSSALGAMTCRKVRKREVVT